MVAVVGASLVGTLMPRIGGTMAACTSQRLTARAVPLPTVVMAAHEERLSTEGTDKGVESNLVHPLPRQDENWTSADGSARVGPYTRPSAEGTPRAQVPAWAFAFTPYSSSV